MPQEERLNAITHFVGLVLAVVGAIFLVTRAVQRGDALQITSHIIFSVSMILLFVASTLFHSLQGASKGWWAKADHCAIYLLIAGTYTPFTLLTLKGPLGWSLFGFVWFLALTGISKELWWGRHSSPWVPLYLAMGWCGLVAAAPLLHHLHGHGWMWLLSGCLFYTAGVPFYAMGRRVLHGHAIWHLFVIGGTASHYITVLRYVP